MQLAIDTSRPIGALVLGRAGMDLYPNPDGSKIRTAQAFVSDVGGSAGNIAVALARYGVSTALVSCLSDDPVGQFVRTRLTEYGVDTRFCRSTRGEPRTSLALAETRPSDCEVVIYRNNAADWSLSPDDIDSVAMSDASVLVVTGLALAVEPSRAATLKALRVARQSGTFTVLDVDHRAYGWHSVDQARCVYREACGLSDAVVGNDAEFDIIAGSETTGSAMAQELVRPKGFSIYKMGAQGSRTFTSERSFVVEPFRVEAKKPFGAGDAFMGGLMGALLNGVGLPDAVTFGSAAAAMVVARQGCASAMPTREEIESFVARNRAGG